MKTYSFIVIYEKIIQILYKIIFNFNLNIFFFKILFVTLAFFSTLIVLSQEGSPYLPENNKIFSETQIHFKWNGYDSLSYQLFLSTDSLFTDLVVDSWVLGVDTIININNEGQYYWRIKKK